VGLPELVVRNRFVPSNSTEPKAGVVRLVPVANFRGADVAFPAGRSTVPVNVGLAAFALRLNAVCCAVETGLFASEVLVTLPRPTIDAVIPPTVPVNVGLARGALRSSAVCCAVETGLFASLVLVTLPRPTIDAEMPLTVPVNDGLARGALSASFPLSLLIAVRIVSLELSVPAPET
jgi:hypothetical protein